MKKFSILFISILLLSIGILIGYNLPKEEEISFYGTVIEINESSLHVQGIPENDINHRGEFVLNITPKTKMINLVSLSELPTNSLIKITYSGNVLESYPAQINDVTKIELTK